MISITPQFLGLFPFQIAFLWLINGGYYSLTIPGMILQVRPYPSLKQPVDHPSEPEASATFRQRFCGATTLRAREGGRWMILYGSWWTSEMWFSLWWTDLAMENGPRMKMYALLKMGIFQPAMLVYWRVHSNIPINPVYALHFVFLLWYLYCFFHIASTCFGYIEHDHFWVLTVCVWRVPICLQHVHLICYSVCFRWLGLFNRHSDCWFLSLSHLRLLAHLVMVSYHRITLY